MHSKYIPSPISWGLGGGGGGEGAGMSSTKGKVFEPFWK